VFPDPTWVQGDWPYWVQRVAQEIAKASYPTAHFKVGKKWEVGEVAAIIGQEIAYFDSWTEWTEKANITEKQWTELKKRFSLFRDVLPERVGQIGRDGFVPGFGGESIEKGSVFITDPAPREPPDRAIGRVAEQAPQDGTVG